MDIFVLILINLFVFGWDISVNIIWFVAILVLSIFFTHWVAVVLAYIIILYLENRTKPRP